MGRLAEGELPIGFTRLKNGLIQYRFNVNGKRCAVYGNSVMECRKKEPAKRDKVLSEDKKLGDGQTVKQYYERWTKFKRNQEQKVKETTIRTRNVLFNAMAKIKIESLGRTFGDLKMVEVKQDVIYELRSSLQKDRTTRTVNDSIYLLNTVFKKAVEDELIKKNPAKNIAPLSRTEPQARDTIHRALSKAETAAFLKAAEEVKSSYSNLYVFLLHTGCRIGEAGAIRLSDIGKNGVRVCRTVTRTEGGGYTIGEWTKTAAGKRTIHLDQQARQAIDNQKRINEAFNDAGALDLAKPIFRTAYGSLLKSTNINQDIERICKRANIERFTVHAFRDTFATRCVESGMQPKILQDIMGHTDINMTMSLYAHSMDETRAAQLEAVNF